MFEGNTFLPVTGMPIRKIACISRPFAEADPVPFAVAILNAKSLTRSMNTLCSVGRPLSGSPTRTSQGPRHAYAIASEGIDIGSPASDVNHRLAHVPCVRRTAFGAEAAVDANVLVFHHHAAG